MEPIQIDMSKIEAAMKLLPDGQPFTMVNLLRYRDVAGYEGVSPPPFLSGRDAYYKGYCRAVFPMIRAGGGEIYWFGHVQIALHAEPGEEWDDVLLVRYPDFAKLVAMVGSDEYQAVLHHRVAGLADTKVLATFQSDPPF